MQHYLDGTKKLLPVDICLLRDEDINLMYRIAEKWNRKTKYGDLIITGFLNFVCDKVNYAQKKAGHNFFMLKPIDKKEFKTNGPYCLAETRRWLDSSENKTYVELSYLQNSHNTLKLSEQKEISGCGEMMVYGVSRFARTEKNGILYLNSANHGFYQKIFQKKPTSDNEFIMTHDELIKFLRRVNKKYQLPKNQRLPKEIMNEISANNYIENYYL